MFTNKHFVLASTSKSRILILKKLNLNFVKKKPKCDEDYYKKKLKRKNISANKISLELSKIKAKSVSVKNKNKIVVGCDTVIDLGGKMIDKVNNKINAEKKIKKLSGKKHKIITSVSVYYNTKLLWFLSEKTKVEIRRLNSIQIKKYLNSCGSDVLNSVGCYQLERSGPLIIKNIKGDFFNVMGFPLFPFLNFLNNVDVGRLKKIYGV